MRLLLFLPITFIFTCCSKTASKPNSVAHENTITQDNVKDIMNAMVWATEEPSVVYDNYLNEIEEDESFALISKFGKYIHVVREAFKGDAEAIKIVELVQKRSDASAHELNSGIIQVIKKHNQRNIDGFSLK